MLEEAERQLNCYLDHLCHEKRVSPHTTSNYQRDLQRLSDYCDSRQIECWQALNPQDIRAHIAGRHRAGLSSKSLQRELSAIRSFYTFLLKKQWLENNPAQQIKAPKQAKKLPKILDVDQINGLLDAGTSSALEVRDLAMFELFYSSGLRLTELASLDLNDLDLDEQSLLVRMGKGGKSRILPIGSHAITALKNWLPLRFKQSQPTESAVFVSKRGTRLGQRSIELRLSQWCQKKGLAEHVHPHLLRHCFASHLLESSRDLRAVQELLGHSNINTTQIYTHLDFQHLADIYDNTHPRAKKISK